MSPRTPATLTLDMAEARHNETQAALQRLAERVANAEQALQILIDEWQGQPEPEPTTEAANDEGPGEFDSSGVLRDNPDSHLKPGMSGTKLTGDIRRAPDLRLVNRNLSECLADLNAANFAFYNAKR